MLLIKDLSRSRGQKLQNQRNRETEIAPEKVHQDASQDPGSVLSIKNKSSLERRRKRSTPKRRRPRRRTKAAETEENECLFQGCIYGSFQKTLCHKW